MTASIYLADTIKVASNSSLPAQEPIKHFSRPSPLGRSACYALYVSLKR